MAIKIHRAEEGLQAVEDLGNRRISTKCALEAIANLIEHNLCMLSVTSTIQNCGQIANLLFAHLFPDEPFSMFIKGKVDNGGMPNFSDSNSEAHAVFRGCAVFVSMIRDFASMTPQSASAAAEIYQLINEMGHLPSEVWE